MLQQATSSSDSEDYLHGGKALFLPRMINISFLVGSIALRKVDFA